MTKESLTQSFESIHRNLPLTKYFATYIYKIYAFYIYALKIYIESLIGMDSSDPSDCILADAFIQQLICAR